MQRLAFFAFVFVMVISSPASAGNRTVEEELAQLRSELDTLERDYTRLEEQLASVRGELDKNPESAALKAREDDVFENMDNISAELSELTRRLEALERVHAATGIRFGDPIILGPIAQKRDGESYKIPDEFALPPTAMTVSLPLESVVRTAHKPLWACYLDELRQRSLVPGKVVVKFVIQPDGSVSSATTKATTLDNPRIETCLNQVFLGFKFPAREELSLVSYPLSLNEHE